MRPRIVLGVVLVLAMARPASAELGFFRWWDSLSGPGPFSGVVFDPVFVCYGAPRIPGATKTTPSAATPATPGWAPFDLGCRSTRRDELRVNIGLEFARLTGKNNLPYASGTAPDVKAYPFMMTVTVSKHAMLDAGAGVGFVRFSGGGFGFTRFAFEPRATVRPLVGLSRSEFTRRRLEFLQLRAFGTAIPGEITAADFGATGTWSSPKEWLPGFMVVFDLSALIWP